MAATVDEIAARSGLTKGTVHLYFRSKEEIHTFLMVEGTLLFEGGDGEVSPSRSSRRTAPEGLC